MIIKTSMKTKMDLNDTLCSQTFRSRCFNEVFILYSCKKIFAMFTIEKRNEKMSFFAEQKSADVNAKETGR